MPERKRFLLRIDPRLYAALERWAAAELRSVNAQIEYLLTEAAKKAGRLKPDAQAEPPPDDEQEG
ncbi:MAG TPA: DNA-binding protein [Trueperaceae bacterium]|nr:DNA-binding protein [Trueperaceae bacterium]